MKREEDQQLWDLMGRARPVELSPFFARNLVRKVREQPRRFAWMPIWLTPRKLLPVAGVVVAVMAAVIALHQPAIRSSGDSAPDVLTKIDPQDYDVVADLDELLTTDESNVWDGDDIQTL